MFTSRPITLLRIFVLASLFIFLHGCSTTKDNAGGTAELDRSLDEISEAIDRPIYATLEEKNNEFRFSSFSMENGYGVPDVDLATFEPAFKKAYRKDCNTGESPLTFAAGFVLPDERVDDNACVQENEYFVRTYEDGRHVIAKVVVGVITYGLGAGLSVAHAAFDQEQYDEAVLEAVENAGGRKALAERLSGLQSSIDRYDRARDETQADRIALWRQRRSIGSNADIRWSIQDQVNLVDFDEEYLEKFVTVEPVEDSDLQLAGVNELSAETIDGLSRRVRQKQASYMDSAAVRAVKSGNAFSTYTVECKNERNVRWLSFAMDCPGQVNLSRLENPGLEIAMRLQSVSLRDVYPGDVKVE